MHSDVKMKHRALTAQLTILLLCCAQNNVYIFDFLCRDSLAKLFLEDRFTSQYVFLEDRFTSPYIFHTLKGKVLGAGGGEGSSWSWLGMARTNVSQQLSNNHLKKKKFRNFVSLSKKHKNNFLFAKRRKIFLAAKPSPCGPESISDGPENLHKYPAS